MQFKLPQGKDQFTTGLGLGFTTFIALAVAFYMAIQLIKMTTFEDTDVMLSARDSFYTYEHVQSEGLQIAFGITAYDSNAESIDDPSMGLLKPYYKTWGLHEGGGVFFETLKYRNCTEGELHVKG